jgi:hypothetical protein
MVHDLSAINEISVVSDVGNEQTNPFTSVSRLAMNTVWRQAGYIQLSLSGGTKKDPIVLAPPNA